MTEEPDPPVIDPTEDQVKQSPWYVALKKERDDLVASDRELKHRVASLELTASRVKDDGEPPAQDDGHEETLDDLVDEAISKRKRRKQGDMK